MVVVYKSRITWLLPTASVTSVHMIHGHHSTLGWIAHWETCHTVVVYVGAEGLVIFERDPAEPSCSDERIISLHHQRSTILSQTLDLDLLRGQTPVTLSLLSQTQSECLAEPHSPQSDDQILLSAGDARLSSPSRPLS
ncbi:hypothetical protein IW261DRAFT_1465709 [Armillaria novae-zelandiae]|uniref:Uncharacterized protein n=1 Tax=Armillaria novae-zelandiae TaxID=153914 RepID=A0AA39PGL6_9AGAR|nr:hypothetical protein IW261DRAFT_1465709 [Armillaria novae-zelandiae]